MLSHDDITQQRALLAAHRKTLAVLLAQQAMHGDAYAPPSVLTGIDDARGDRTHRGHAARRWRRG